MNIDSTIVAVSHSFEKNEVNEKAVSNQVVSNQVVSNDSFWLQVDIDLKSIFLLMKKLCNVMRSFNEKVQELAFKLDVNILNKRQSAIDDTFYSSLVKSIGGVTAGVATLGMSYYLSPIAGKAISSTVESSLSIGADKINANAQNENVLAEFQTKAAQSFTKNSDALMSTSRESMRTTIDIQRQITQIIFQSNSEIVKKI